MSIRIRQLVFASNQQSDIACLGHVLGLGAPYVDPGVGEFGLTNGIFALGDQFLEVVVPTQANTAAERFLDRNQGEGGYMAIFQTDDLESVRRRADKAKIRRVWNADLPDISASHFHPADIGAAIVSVDEARPEGSWRWGGPDWQEASIPGTITGATITACDTQALLNLWQSLLGDPLDMLNVVPGDKDMVTGFTLELDQPEVVLKRAKTSDLETNADSFKFCGVTVSLKAS
ncbi:MAG: hypothetical protein ABNH53_04625 [Henriciella sp.]|jgi:hypothetical protein